MDYETTKTSNFVNINGFPIWYDKHGTGQKILLLIPGGIGTGESDFKQQLSGPNAFDYNKYTMIAIELAGWGRSRPPKRPYGPNIYEFDADCALKLMETLGYNSYSIIGWSEGAKVACIMAIKRPSRIVSITLIALWIIINDKTLAPICSTRSIEKFSNFYDNLVPIYGDNVHTMWNDFINFLTCNPLMFPDGYWTKDFSKIRCPALMIHGDKDPIVCNDHPIYGSKQIPDCVLHRFANGSHNVHQSHACEFKSVVEKFFNDYEDF